MENKNSKGFAISRFSYFNGKRRIGLDANILIKLYDQPYFFDYEQARIFKQENLVFTHKICVWELTKHIIKTKKLNENEAREKAKSFVTDKKITPIYEYFSKDDVKSFENKTNLRFKNEGKSNLYCHYPDSIILLGFKKSGINKIITDDWSFRESAKFLGIDSERLPSLDNKISQELKRIFGINKKFKKR